MTTRNAKPKFENRVRFNWGYHDAVFAVRNNLATPNRNYGFCNRGPLSGLTSVDDIVARHFDHTYAIGWKFGYYEALGGISPCNTSEYAWADALKAGSVSE